MADNTSNSGKAKTAINWFDEGDASYAHVIVDVGDGPVMVYLHVWKRLWNSTRAYALTVGLTMTSGRDMAYGSKKFVKAVALANARKVAKEGG